MEVDAGEVEGAETPTVAKSSGLLERLAEAIRGSEESEEEKQRIKQAETYGQGINMFLLSQGHYVRALAPEKLCRGNADRNREDVETILMKV